MKTLFPLTTVEAKKRWQKFEYQLNSLLRPLTPNDQSEVKKEVMSHVYEAALRSTQSNEVKRLDQAIERMGDLSLFVQPLVHDILQDQTYAGNRSTPASLVKLTGQNLGYAFVAMLTGFSYLFLLLLLSVGVWSFFDPTAGLWLHQDGTFTLSFDAHPNSIQWLGAGFKWLAMGVSVLGFVVLSHLLRWLLSRNQAQPSCREKPAMPLRLDTSR